MNETELLATLQVVFVLLCGVLVFSLVCTAVVAVRGYHHKRVVRHHAKHSRGPEVPVSNMVVPKSTKEGVEYTTSESQSAQSEPQDATVEEGPLSTPSVTEFTTEEPKQTWNQPSGYSRAPRKRHARHGR